MPTRPRLSVCGITWRSANRLEQWGSLAREIADEIVLLVDASSPDDTVDVARRVADRVQLVEHPSFIEEAMDWGLRAATGDWLLWLDDDEVVAPTFGDRLGDLVARPDLTHYWLPYRWVVARPDGGYGWLRTFPWYPNPRLRLIRNIGSVFCHRGALHSPITVAGEGEVLTDDDVAIYHLDFLHNDRAAREQKVERYRGHRAPSCEEYYLWEDYAETLDVVALDPAVVERQPSRQARRHVRRRAAAPEEPAPVSSEVMARALAAHLPVGPVFAAGYGRHTTPTTVLANRGYTVELEIENRSAVPWRTTGLEHGRVVLGYHWVSPAYGTLLRDGDVTLLPGAWAPGSTGTVSAGLWTPYDPGRYRLEWDLLAQGVNWFSERDVPALGVDVEVADGDRLLGTPRTVARLPARSRPAARPPSADGVVASPPPEATANGPERGPLQALRVLAMRTTERAARKLAVSLPRRCARPWPGAGAANYPAAANLIPITPMRVLDTRDGSGFPGAVTGPIKAGEVVTVELAGQPNIPLTAVGVVGNLAVVGADYGGFVSAYPAGDRAGDGCVALYFAGGSHPAVNQVVVALGREDQPGRVSFHVSGEQTGTVQLLFDVFAYLD